MATTIVAVPRRQAAGVLRSRALIGASSPVRAPAGAVVALTSPFKGFGYVQYLPLANTPGALFAAGVPIPLAMAADGTQTLNTLTGPFAGWSFWDGANLNARAIGDAYDIRLTVQAVSSVAEGCVFCEAIVNGAALAIEVDQDSLSKPAGTPQTLSFKLKLYPKATFVAGGARLYLTSDVPVTITNEKLIIEPTNAG